EGSAELGGRRRHARSRRAAADQLLGESAGVHFAPGGERDRVAAVRRHGRGRAERRVPGLRRSAAPPLASAHVELSLALLLRRFEVVAEPIVTNLATRRAGVRSSSFFRERISLAVRDDFASGQLGPSYV